MSVKCSFLLTLYGQLRGQLRGAAAADMRAQRCSFYIYQNGRRKACFCAGDTKVTDSLEQVL